MSPCAGDALTGLSPNNHVPVPAPGPPDQNQLPGFWLPRRLCLQAILQQGQEMGDK